MIIESRSNERVKQARKLLLRKERKSTGLHLIESEKLVREAIDSGARVVSLFVETDSTLPRRALLSSIT